MAVSVVALAAGAWLYTTNLRNETRPSVYQGRGFFGVVHVQETKARVAAGEGCIREYTHGTTVHGIQALLPGRERMPTTYYAPDGCGYAIVAHPNYREGKPMRVCLVGLGLGVLYAYARPVDYYCGYEISRESLELATSTNLFTFVSGCPARHREILQDARNGLEQELAAGEEQYDVIIIDAYSGDNQPYHISTKEAFELYLKRLKPDGVLCVHITNWHLQLEPFIKSVGDTFALPLLGFASGDDYGRLKFGTKAAFFCRQPEKLGAPPAGVNMIDFAQVKPMPYLPTDEKGSFIDLIKW